MEVDVLSDDPLAQALPAVEPITPIPNALPVIEPQPNWKDVVTPALSEEQQLYEEFKKGPKPGLTEPEKEAERERYRKAGLIGGGHIRGDLETIWESIPQPDDYAETQAAKQAAGQRDATIAEIQESHKVNGTINLILDPRISAKDLANIAEKKENGFDLVSETLQLRPQWTPEIQTKVSEAHRILNERRRVIPTGKDIVESGIELPTMFADWVGATWGWAKQFKTGVIGESSDSPLSRIFSGGGPGPENLTPEDAEARRLRELKAVGQATAASAASMTHFGTELPLDFVEKVLGKNAAEWTPEDSAANLANKISRNVNRKNILAGGGGEFIPKFSPGVREEMKAGDSDIDPVVSEEIEAGDPFSLMAIGPAFKGIGVVLQVPKAAFKAATRAGLGAAADAAFVAAAPAEVRGALLGAIEGEAAKRGVVGEISKAAGEIIGPTARKVDEALSAAGKFIPSAQTVVGKGIQSVGVVADTFAKWAENVAPGVTRAATAAALIGGSTSGLGNVVAGFLAGGGNISKFVKPVMGTLGAIRKQAQNLGYTGKSIAAATSEQMAATPIRGSAAAAIKGAAQSVPRVAEGAIHGAALDLSLSALTTLTSDNHSALQLGAALGVVGGLRSGFMRTVGEVRMGARDWGHDTPVPTSGVIQPFETMSASAYAAAPRGVQRRVNSLRQLLKGIDANADLFMADPTKAEQRQVSTTNFDGTTHVRWKEIHTDTEAALIELGFSKSQAEFYAGQNGWFDANLSVPGQPGKTKRVIVVNSVDSAPHEAKHAFQNVNGELANQVLDRVVRDSFNDEMWDFLGRDYTEKLLQRRLRPDESWADLVLGASGDGATAADLKLKLHAVEELQRTLGREATNEEVRALHSVTATDAGIVSTVETQGGWREVLTPAERKQAADRYIAREISAETFDAVFKHFGPAMAEKGGLISFFAKLVASTVDLLGGDSLRGRTSEVLAVPLRPEIVGEVTSQVRGRLAEVAGSRRPVVTPEVRPTQKPSPLPSGAPAPVTPEDRAAAAEEARTFAEKAADAPLHNVADAQSPKETLGIVAEAIANDSGVSYEYYGARGEKTSIDPDKKREQRRKEIEGSRNFPNDMRDLLGRRGFPYRVDQRGSVIQVLDWTPDMLASNALRWAKALSELSKKDPENPALQRIPKEFQLDVAAEDWTTETWRKILDSSKAFSENQLAGFTGAGEELVIPRNLPGMKEFSNPRQIGTPTSIDQNTADFVNMLYSLRPPETPRAGDAIPRNIAAQNIAEATGGAERVVEPAQREVSGRLSERKPFSTEVTARYGRGDIKEINPLRGELERALQNAGIPIPKTIEVVRRLNVDRIHSANHEPLLAKTVGGNIVTLQSGFSPPAKPNNEMAIRSAAVRDETTGRIYEAGIHAIAREDAESRGAKGPFTDGYVTNRKIPGNKLEFLNRDEASARAEEIGQMSSAALQGAGGLESSRFELTRKFNPKQLVTPENEKRFAESVVRFADGTLKPVFHATVADFTPEQINTDAFQAHFGAPAAAADRVLGDPNTRNTAARENDAGQRTLPVFLDIKNPLRLPDAGNWESAQRVSLELYKKFGRKLPTEYRETAALGKVDSLTSEYYDEARGMDEQAAYAKANLEVLNEMKQWVEEQGYDGIVYKNEFEKAPVILREEFGSEIESEYGTDSFIAFSNDQVHSALKFSPGKRKEIELEGPDGKKYKATFDGYWDWTSVGRGHIPSFTALEDMPGAFAKNGTGMGPSFEKAGYKLPTDLPAPEDTGPVAFSAKPSKDEPRVGLEFKKFFSDVTKGNFGKSDKPFEPIVDLSGAENIIESKSNHSGNFDDHIAKSIPTFYETQIKKAKAISGVYGAEGARVLDIAASEGSFGKSISDVTAGKVETVSLDPNPDMAAFFESKSKVPGATYAQEAFLHGFEDAGKEYTAHDPAQPYDVITESMGFQFIDADRAPQIAEVKRLLKPDGVFLTEQKVRNTDWAANEAKKDSEFKSKYFSDAELKQKDTRVGFAQSKTEAKAVGMIDNMADQATLEKILTDNFGHVVQYWDSGNFKGYAAGDNAAKVNEIVQAMGDTTSDFSTVSLPREVRFGPRKQKPNAAEEDVFDLVHYSSTPGLRTVDPKHFGKGKATPTDLRGGPKSYFFVKGSDFGQDAAIFENAGLHPHAATVKGSDLYDLRAGKPDDLGWRKTVNREEADDIVIDAGYKGIILDTADGRQVVSMFKTVKVSEPGGAAFSPGKGIIGRVDEDGEIMSKKGNLGFMSHNSLTGSGEAWRYVQDTGEVFWWFNKPDAKTQDIVTSWLESKGNKVSSHKVLGEGTPEQDFSRSHGRFSPKREQFEDPETIREALASPGWAIITGTQEKIAGKSASWDDPRNIAANARLKAELKAKGYETIVTEGKYKGESQGESFAIMGITPAEAQAIGKKYGQESIITNKGLVYGDGSTTPAVPEKTLIGPEAEAQDFYSITPDGTAFSIGLDFDKPYKPVGEQQELFGKTESEAQDFSRRVRARIADKKERFPESAPLGYEKNADGSFRINAKTGKPVPEKQDHNFLDSGLAKESGKGLRGEAREAAYVKAAGDAMAKEYRDAMKDPEVAAGASWYSKLRTKLRKLFGDQSQLVCEVLAALSSRTPVRVNYKFGIDAVNKFNAGDYDAQLKKYQEGLDRWDAGNISDFVQATGLTNPERRTFVNWWIDTHDLRPRQSNGKLFAANSKALLKALHGSWTGGKKTRQFSQNMSGSDFGSTIDVWAARTLHRISNENRVARWRILAEHENAVQDADFDVAQKVFKHAADKVGIKPDALQGVLWFREKDLWEKRGWTRGTGAEKSDISSLISETEKTSTGQYKMKNPQGELKFSPKKKLGECVGNCINAKIVEDIFGSVSEFAGQVEEHGDNFSYRGVQVVYDPKKDIHTFYKDTDVQPRPSKLVADQIKAQVDESRAWIAGRSMNK